MALKRANSTPVTKNLHNSFHTDLSLPVAQHILLFLCKHLCLWILLSPLNFSAKEIPAKFQVTVCIASNCREASCKARFPHLSQFLYRSISIATKRSKATSVCPFFPFIQSCLLLLILLASYFIGQFIVFHPLRICFMPSTASSSAQARSEICRFQHSQSAFFSFQVRYQTIKRTRTARSESIQMYWVMFCLLAASSSQWRTCSKAMPNNLVKHVTQKSNNVWTCHKTCFHPKTYLHSNISRPMEHICYRKNARNDIDRQCTVPKLKTQIFNQQLATTYQQKITNN